ncbi:precorrin-6A synthase (deacetylating) [Mesorhizobium sp. M1406]|uniref:precorrin-6A synthase (deacetylating) n=1 Tax=Mesorhizobium sp. M1406 TaxID=2957099 RepID=UPI00333AD3C6
MLIIGIGAGNPDFVTIQAVNAMNQVDVFFIPDKGIEKDELARVRREILERHVRDRPFRTVEFKAPERKRTGEYEVDVSDWHDDVEAAYSKLIMEELDASETGAFLVWGDPTLYDSTMRILDRLKERGEFELDYEVLPGINSIQALAARHKVALCNIGRSILISTGRTMAEGFPNKVDSVVIMLNAEKALRAVDGDLDIYWGAYVGMPDEVLVAGKFKEVIDEIERIREEARYVIVRFFAMTTLKRPALRIMICDHENHHHDT